MKKFKVVTIILLIVVALLGVYWYLSQRSDVPNEIDTEVSELSKVLAKDITKEYPSTPREVVKLYSRITKCFYDSELSDEQLEKLTDMSFALFDEELLEVNPKNEYMVNLREEIDEYKAADRVVLEYKLQDAQSVEKYYLDGVEYAKVKVEYRIKDLKVDDEKKDAGFLSGCGNGRENKTYQYYSTYEEFLLRRDSNEAWKILAWRAIDVGSMED